MERTIQVSSSSSPPSSQEVSSISWRGSRPNSWKLLMFLGSSFNAANFRRDSDKRLVELHKPKAYVGSTCFKENGFTTCKGHTIPRCSGFQK